MKIINSIPEMKKFCRKHEYSGKKIGFVPTMGYLHEGHMSLVKEAKKGNDVVVLSIFVNPIQFGPKEDLKKYPRDMERDSRMAKEAGVDAIFYPDAACMYPAGYSTYVDVKGLSNNLCGMSRPGHFTGVATVVTKLFEIVRPTNAYLGQKDAQQAAIIGRMASDLNMDVKIKVCPIVREPDGLAMSSRNVYLNSAQRQDALVLSRSLKAARDMFRKGERHAGKIIKEVRMVIRKKKTVRIDYIKITDLVRMEDVKKIHRKALLALAVYVGRTRLIDNIILGE